MDWKIRHSIAKSLDSLVSNGYDEESAVFVIQSLRHLNHDRFSFLHSRRESKEEIKGLTDLGEITLDDDDEDEKRIVKDSGAYSERIGQFKVRVRPGCISFWYFAETSINTSADLHKLVATDKYAILFHEGNGDIDFCRYVYSEPKKVYSFLCSIIFAIVAVFSFGTLTKGIGCINFYKVERAVKSLINEERVYHLEPVRYVDVC